MIWVMLLSALISLLPILINWFKNRKAENGGPLNSEEKGQIRYKFTVIKRFISICRKHKPDMNNEQLKQMEQVEEMYLEAKSLAGEYGVKVYDKVYK